MLIALSRSHMSTSLWGLTLIVALNTLLFVLVLTKQALVARSIVVVREKLSQEKVHIRSSLSGLANTAIVPLLRVV